MDPIVELAAKLGDAIAGDERCKKLKGAVAALEKDEEAKTLQASYHAAAQLLQTKEAENSVIEPEEKRAEADLRAKVAGNELLMGLLRAQADSTR